MCLDFKASLIGYLVAKGLRILGFQVYKGKSMIYPMFMEIHKEMTNKKKMRRNWKELIIHLV
jgi:hypothetical protein